jgi:hypothetical protein
MDTLNRTLNIMRRAIEILTKADLVAILAPCTTGEAMCFVLLIRPFTAYAVVLAREETIDFANAMEMVA